MSWTLTDALGWTGLALHAAILAVLLGLRAAIVRAGRRAARPGRLALRADRQVGRAWPFALVGAALLAALPAVGRSGSGDSPWILPWLRGLALGFHAPALPVEFAAVAAQVRLRREARAAEAPEDRRR